MTLFVGPVYFAFAAAMDPPSAHPSIEGIPRCHAGDGEWGIALRCAQIDPDAPERLRLFAGCGIVADSDPVREWEESRIKLQAVVSALGMLEDEA